MRDPAQTMRRLLGAVWILGSLGVAAELVLSEHYEDRNQLIPFVALGAALLALVWHRLRPGRASWVTCRLLMLALVVVAGLGLYLHLQANMEFEHELDETLEGWPLVLAALRSTSPPALAPGVLALLGAIGWIATIGRRKAPHA